MQQSKVFYYPKSIRDILVSHLNRSETFKEKLHTDKFLYIMHRLYWFKLNYPAEYRKDGVPINAIKMKETIAEKNWSPFCDALVEWRLIIRYSESYRPEHYSKCFKLHPDVEDMDINRNRTLTKRKNDWLAKVIEGKHLVVGTTPVETYQYEILKQVTFDDSVCDYIAENYPKEIARLKNNIVSQKLAGFLSFIEGELYCHRAPRKHSRLYSNVTTIKREFRQFLRLNGEEFRILDLKNAQIFLGYYAIHDFIQNYSEGTINENEYPDDIKLFKRLAVAGEFYEYLSGKMGINITTKWKRKLFKDKFFAYLWYAELSDYTFIHPVYQAFKAHFPHVLKIIIRIKESSHRDFPIMLQDNEAYIMLDTIGRKLMDCQIPFLTIHDAIMIPNNINVRVVKKIVTDSFWTHYNAIPGIDVKRA